MKWKILGTLLLLSAAVLLNGSDARLTPIEVPASNDPEYDEAGKLKRPDLFRGWVFVGSNLGLGYRPDLAEQTVREKDRHKDAKVGDFHNVYLRPEAYEHFKKSRTFPEKTVLVMEVFEAKERDSKGVVSRGYFPGDHRRIEVAVKNSARPDGEKTPWAYYIFPPNAKTAPAFSDDMCYKCHRKHADLDNVWIQFYPVLGAGKE